MFKIALVLLVVCVLGVQISDQSSIGTEIEDRETDDQLAEKEWKDFKTSKKLKYDSKEEPKRKTLFKTRRTAIKKHNANSKNTYKRGYNQFTHQTDDERKIVLGCKKKPKRTTPKPTTTKRTTTTTTTSTTTTTTPEPDTVEPDTVEPDTDEPDTVEPDTTTPPQKAKTTTKPITTKPTTKPTTKKPVTAVDWRSDKCMPAVRDQGACGSCWAFAAMVLVEFGTCVNKTKTSADLSEQQVVSCSTVNYGCQGGWQDEALKYMASAVGVATETSYKYTSGSGGVTGKCAFTSKNVIGGKVSTAKPVNYITPGDINAMKNMLAAKILVTVDIAVVQSFMDYSNGVYTEPNCASGILGYHAITAVGFGKEMVGGVSMEFWIIRNSWSAGWGLAGYIKFQLGVNLCGVEDNPVATNIV